MLCGWGWVEQLFYHLCDLRPTHVKIDVRNTTKVKGKKSLIMLVVYLTIFWVLRAPNFGKTWTKISSGNHYLKNIQYLSLFILRLDDK